MALLAEDELVRTQLQKLDVPVQVTQHVNPIQVLPARILSSMYQKLGKDSLTVLVVAYISNCLLNQIDQLNLNKSFLAAGYRTQTQVVIRRSKL